MHQITGWDASSSMVGVVTVGDDGRMVKKSHIDLRKAESMWDKATLVRDFIRKNKTELGGEHVLEDRLSGFTRGMTSQQTLMKLSAWNALIAFLIQDETGSAPVMMHPATAKAQLKKDGFVIDKESEEDKKDQKLSWAARREQSWVTERNRKGNPQPWSYDEADALGLAVAEWIRTRRT